MATGWIGPTDIVLRELNSAGADRDDDGRPILGGPSVIVGMGAVEVLVPDGVWYTVGGEARALLPLLARTGRGAVVTII